MMCGFGTTMAGAGAIGCVAVGVVGVELVGVSPPVAGAVVREAVAAVCVTVTVVVEPHATRASAPAEAAAAARPRTAADGFRGIVLFGAAAAARPSAQVEVVVEPGGDSCQRFRARAEVGGWVTMATAAPLVDPGSITPDCLPRYPPLPGPHPPLKATELSPAEPRPDPTFGRY